VEIFCVKCTDSLRAGAYETRATYTIGDGRAVYAKRDIDFIAAHVVPLNFWYIIPVEVCTPHPMGGWPTSGCPISRVLCEKWGF
jgi:hypothetical protein